jgi:hypothetical protein
MEEKIDVKQMYALVRQYCHDVPEMEKGKYKIYGEYLYSVEWSMRGKKLSVYLDLEKEPYQMRIQNIMNFGMMTEQIREIAQENLSIEND